MSKVDKSESAGACWLWMAGRDELGYGKFDTAGHRTMGAHRAAVLLLTDDVPGKRCVLHRCDNPPCVNPAHLFLGTHKDNVSDRESKGRGRAPQGEQVGTAKLTEAQAKDVIEQGRNGVVLREIAVKYGVAVQTVSRIVMGKSWRHIQ